MPSSAAFGQPPAGSRTPRCFTGNIVLAVLVLVRGCRHRCSRAHGLHDPLEVLHRSELDDYLALMPALFYFDAGLEQVRQAIGEAEESGCDRLPTDRGGTLASGLVAAAEGDDLLDGADGQTLGHDPGGQALLRGGVVQAEEGAGVAGTEHTRSDAPLYGRGEVEQPQGVSDVRAGAAYLARQLLVGGTEIVKELLVGGGLLERVELLAVQVLDQGIPEQLIVLGLLDDGADLGHPGPLAGPPSTLAHDELIPAWPGRTDNYWLQQADLPDRLRELVESLVVEGPPWLPGIRRDRGDVDLPVVSAENLSRHTRSTV